MDIPKNIRFQPLPERTLPAPYTRCGAKELLGYYDKTCHHCGKAFEATQQHKYRMTIDDKDCWFCRYNCFRPYEEAEAEKYRAIRLGFTKKNRASKGKSLEQCTREHLEKCRKKLAEWQAKHDNPEYWNKLTKGQKSSVYSNIALWKENVQCAELMLKEVMGNENT